MCFLKDWSMIGVVDSDGSYNLRLKERKGNKLGVGICIEITQKTANREVLESIKKKLNSTNKILDKRGINQRTGAIKEHSVFGVFFDSSPGEKLLRILKKKNHFCPGKRRDFEIAMKFFEYSKNKYVYTRLNSLDWSNEKKEKVSAVATATLAYQTSHERFSKNDSQKKKKSLNDWIDYLRPSVEELEEGKKLASQFCSEIDQKIDALSKFLNKENVCLPKAYLIGFFIGDGCIGVYMNFK